MMTTEGFFDFGSDDWWYRIFSSQCHNANTEQEQLKTLQNLSITLENFDTICSYNVIIAGDFNLFVSKKLECKGGDLYLKKHSVSHIIKILETFGLCDIWWIRNPKTKSFIFGKKHFSGDIQRRLDYIFISNSLQERISNVDILNEFWTDQNRTDRFFVLS